MNDIPSYFDALIGLIQVLDFQINITQVSNDVLMKELTHQTQDYLEILVPKVDKIIEQNEEIIKLLTKED